MSLSLPEVLLSLEKGMATKPNYQIHLVYKFHKSTKTTQKIHPTSYIFFVIFDKIENIIRHDLQITKYFTRIISMIIIATLYIESKSLTR